MTGAAIVGLGVPKFGPLRESVIPVRGHGGTRQVPRNAIALMSCYGGILEYNSTPVLGRRPRP
jgi:hypothetical protein